MLTVSSKRDLTIIGVYTNGRLPSWAALIKSSFSIIPSLYGIS